MGTTSALQVAAELRARLKVVEKTKLQKLLYYCQGQHLADTGKPLFYDEILAWRNGPVVPGVWRDDTYGMPDDERPAPILDRAALGTIGYVASVYGHLQGTELGRMTHREPPWKDAYATGVNTPITIESLRAYFEHDQKPPRVDPEQVRRALRASGPRVQHRRNYTREEIAAQLGLSV